jgi:UDP-N-acetylglucosamine diphosphorylase/glucosamine-1-phosphate N-acetyltransferase
VEANAQVLGRDLEWLHGHDDADELPGVHRVGSAALSLGQDARLGPGVVVDTRDGPVRLDDGVVVEGPARLTGPLLLGPGTQVFGGHLSRLSTGPVCKLRGEIDTAVLTGYCNKAHDGYLGHALLGRWVNLGALTTNSDLKNDYGPVRVQIGDQVVDTGLMKVGVFLGDHVKTGIGTVLNTGSVVGAGTNVFGGGMPPKYLPPFSWAGGGEVVPFRWEKFLKVAQVVAARRSQPWTPGVEAVLRRLWNATHGDGPGEST